MEKKEDIFSSLGIKKIIIFSIDQFVEIRV